MTEYVMAPKVATPEMLSAGRVPTIELPLRGGGPPVVVAGLGANAYSIYRAMTRAAPDPLQDEAMIERVARAIHATRIKWGWTLGVRKGPMAIDLEMARAAIATMKGE